jgi:hypothetical protein
MSLYLPFGNRAIPTHQTVPLVRYLIIDAALGISSTV